MTTPCPHCNKSFKNLNQHITKTHAGLNITFRQHNGEIVLSCVDNLGNVHATDDQPETRGDDHECYFMGDGEGKGWNVTLYTQTRVVEVSVSNKLYDKHGRPYYKENTAFKNWKVTFDY
jgi:hypothetical protein